VERLRARSGFDQRFLQAVLGGDSFTAFIRGIETGTSIPHISAQQIRSFEFPCPPLVVQEAIGELIGALEDKTALNRRMNQTLQATAAALFRSWFVDFDPVVAKADSRQATGVSSDAHAAMPTAFTEISGEVVPAGWDVQSIGSLARIVGGSTPSTSEPRYWGGEVRWATPRDLAGRASPVILNTTQRITHEGLGKISSGLLPRGTVLLSARAPIGYIALTAEPMSINQGFIALVCEGPLPNLYVLHWLRANMEAIEARANGTTFLEISRTNFRPIRAVVPSAPVLDEFVRLVGPMHDRIEANERENLTLAALRDTLLPELLSGAVRLRDAEQIVTAAV